MTSKFEPINEQHESSYQKINSRMNAIEELISQNQFLLESNKSLKLEITKLKQSKNNNQKSFPNNENNTKDTNSTKSKSKSDTKTKDVIMEDYFEPSYVDTHVNLPNVLKQLYNYKELNDVMNLDDNALKKLMNDFKKDFAPHCQRFLSVSSESESRPLTKRLMTLDESVYGAFGIHPLYSHDEYKNQENEAQIISEMKSNKKCMAYGEIGLDYHKFKGIEYADPETQRTTFIRQMKIAIESRKPIIIHTREAEKETLDLMKQHIPKDWKIHVHCYTDSADFANRLLSEWPQTLYFGFTGVICLKSATTLQKLISDHTIPLDRLLLETDGPVSFQFFSFFFFVFVFFRFNVLF